MLPCSHYLVEFHYHNCLHGDFKQALPSVPPYAPLKAMGHRHSAAFLRSPNQFLPTALTTPGVLPSDAGLTRESSWHNYPQPRCADNAIICQQMSGAVPAWGCLDHILQNQVVTPVPLNQTQTVGLSVTQEGSASLQLSCTQTEIQMEATKAAGKYLKTKRLCPVSLTKRSWRCFVQVSWKPVLIFPAHLFTQGCVPGATWQVCIPEGQNLTIRSSQWVGNSGGTQSPWAGKFDPFSRRSSPHSRLNTVLWKISNIQKSWNDFTMNHLPTST